MKTTFEFDDTIENFDLCQFRRFQYADETAYCLCQVRDQLREWYKYDNRGSIPIMEVYDTIMGIIEGNIDLEKLGY